MRLLQVLGLGRRASVVALGLGAASVALGLYAYIRADARADLKSEIEDVNDAAQLDAFRADLGYLECVDGGFLYDFGTGQCRRPAPGGR
ncbi:hypothetical protein [uncultured Tateyamaria sp.]|uniref:hypothetical protein n=1 Tax=uncultured Tateyamaria sp. TaxID=455651 RepID=UPI00260D97A7|nr:hypothetical protein [uncultured Tateyamaria sp.]